MTPSFSAEYWKYHGLGNDYIVLSNRHFQSPPTPEAVRLICERHRGIGGDGILWLAPQSNAEWKVDIFNPDGSQAEKSGNGLRIAARFLWERQWVKASPFTLHTLSDPIQTEIKAHGRIALGMGPARFSSEKIPLTGPPREVLGETLIIEGKPLTINAVSTGNPHCVVETENPTPEQAKTLGPLIENHPLFPRRTNVQFMRVLSPHRLKIEIWERGAGYTEASGTSSCAAAAVASRRGYCQSPIEVEVPGGVLTVELDLDYNLLLEGEVKGVNSGRFADDFLETLHLKRAPLI